MSPTHPPPLLFSCLFCTLLHFTCSLLPLYCPLFLIPTALLSHLCPLFFSNDCNPHSGCQKCPSPAGSSAAFFLALCSHTTYELKPSCVISRWISLLVALIASAWYEIRHWLHRFEPQSTALLSWIPACNISHRMCTNAKEMCSNI